MSIVERLEGLPKGLGREWLEKPIIHPNAPFPHLILVRFCATRDQPDQHRARNVLGFSVPLLSPFWKEGEKGGLADRDITRFARPGLERADTWPEPYDPRERDKEGSTIGGLLGKEFVLLNKACRSQRQRSWLACPRAAYLGLLVNGETRSDD